MAADHADGQDTCRWKTSAGSLGSAILRHVCCLRPPPSHTSHTAAPAPPHHQSDHHLRRMNLVCGVNLDCFQLLTALRPPLTSLNSGGAHYVSYRIKGGRLPIIIIFNLIQFN